MLFLLSILGLVHAQAVVQKQTLKNQSILNHLNMRMGFSSATSNGRPTICLQGSLSASFSMEACGTGYGFVHQDLGTDFVHFRGKQQVFDMQFSQASVAGQLGFGFAEIQIGADQLGFQFSGSGDGIETAGPELSSSLQWMYQLGKGTEVLIDMNAGAAYFPHGPDLLDPQPKLFPFWEISTGVGW